MAKGPAKRPASHAPSVAKRPATASVRLGRPAASGTAHAALTSKYVLVSSYTLKLGHVMSPSVEQAKGISVYRREIREDGSFGELTFHWSCSDFPCPTYMCCNAARTRVYAVSEVLEESTVSAYAFDAKKGELKLLNSVATGGSIACHVSLTRNERMLAVANYGGSVALFQLTVEGRISTCLQVQVSESLGVGVNKERQEGPHPHMVHFDGPNQHLLVPDLGLDRVMVYKLDHDSMDLVKHLPLAPGSGPRHLAFHPELNVVYVLNELLSTVMACHYDAASGELTPTEARPTVPGAPVGVQGQTFPAAIRISGDGKFLYASNRGHDSISVFALTEEGLIAEGSPQHFSTAVREVVNPVASWPPRECPRDFALCAEDRYLIAANQDSDSLVVFERHPESGALIRTGISVKCAAPACVLPLF
ncbi:unnamed protein product [Durusdinium trenchii]|uniref:6-phosphogluconolactonase n=1 Tax=Durusdinium trenchii TaxID=1381693 RepID=A0ABP0IZ99_9DINO